MPPGSTRPPEWPLALPAAPGPCAPLYQAVPVLLRGQAGGRATRYLAEWAVPTGGFPPLTCHRLPQGDGGVQGLPAGSAPPSSCQLPAAPWGPAASLLKTLQPRGQGREGLQGLMAGKGILPRVALQVVPTLPAPLAQHTEE